MSSYYKLYESTSRTADILSVKNAFNSLSKETHVNITGFWGLAYAKKKNEAQLEWLTQ